MPPPFLIIPGYLNSGPAHWQTLWENTLPNASRVELGDWDCPHRERWIAKIDAAISACASPPILIAHSLGVIAVAWWASQGPRTNVQAALLVAPPDLRTQVLPPTVCNFGVPPVTHFLFPAVLAASSNDPYCTIVQAKALADCWGARFVDLGDCGHVNTESGLGPWTEGERLLAEITAGR